VRVVALVFTGGTISMRHDVVAGGAIPALGARDILAAARGIDDIADLRVEEWGRFPGPHMTIERMWALRGRLAELVADPEIHGVVVTHGTDTLEESAYLAARAIATDKPIVFTGAMRTASELGWDGPSNLTDAVRVAASEDARGFGSLVVLNNRIFSGLDVTKVHTHMLDGFESPGLGPVGVVDDGTVIFRRALPLLPPVLTPDELAAPVDIIVAYPGADDRLLDASRRTGRGVIVAALGRGNVPLLFAQGIGRWIEDGKPVVVTSRVLRGRVGQTYGYAGGGRRLAAMGAIFAGARRPQQARIDLMLGVGGKLSVDELRLLFAIQ
jgi:L-asparaginase